MICATFEAAKKSVEQVGKESASTRTAHQPFLTLAVHVLMERFILPRPQIRPPTPLDPDTIAKARSPNDAMSRLPHQGVRITRQGDTT